jgi:DNA-binding response OmpR family regulator
MATGRILLLDDEPPLVELMSKYLSRLGYQVDTCNLAQRAWELITVEGTTYDLVVLDLLLPDERGDDLIERIFQRDPNVRVLVCSGVPGGGHLAASGKVRFLQKPFLPKMLANEVALIMAGARPSECNTPVVNI